MWLIETIADSQKNTIERSSARDLHDVQCMLQTGLVSVEALRDGFASIQDKLPRYPGVNAQAFAQRLQHFLNRNQSQQNKG